jgi:hypothetical protein
MHPPVELVDPMRSCINEFGFACSGWCGGEHPTDKLTAVRVGGLTWGETLYSPTESAARRRAQRIARRLGCAVTVGDP